MSLARDNQQVVNAAYELLQFLSDVDTLVSPSIKELEEQAIDLLNQYNTRLTGTQINQNERKLAHYCLCAAIDEAVLSTDWGAQSTWTQQGLLTLFHQERNGGERFYQILYSQLSSKEPNLALLELLYLLLNLGFEGKLFSDPNKIEKLKLDILNAINKEKSESINPLISDTLEKDNNTMSKHRKKFIKLAWVIVITLLILTYIIFNVINLNKANETLSSFKKTVTTTPEVVYKSILDHRKRGNDHHEN